jgi:hypothetical protein
VTQPLLPAASRRALGSLDTAVGSKVTASVTDRSTALEGAVRAGVESGDAQAVQRVLTAFQAAVVKSVSDQVVSGYAASTRLGVSVAARQLQVSPADVHDVLPSSDYLSSVLAQLSTAVLDQSAKFQASLGEQLPKWESTSAQGAVATQLARDFVQTMALRAQLAASSAIRRGFSDAQEQVYQQQPGVRKMWVAHFDNHVPCPTCSALHGQIVTVGSTFDPATTFAGKVLSVFGFLTGPPRHPNCECELVPVQGDEVPTLQAPPALTVPSRMSAADVRAMPAASFRALVSVFASVIARSRGGGSYRGQHCR